ncbi:hypothetical protein [Spartinivicinus poritis]|uniref:Uncharacterized protein n=1 Tax=Spartinivicinus poritis TaxID=2994640 RepID=A0ABT5UB72_9GAMM|nr:hypothetical protein [Spartinivicinus sp. A2-2]MDE1462688.1 hypothetical protein [Spartinivicinus sp. A2-2]
MNLQEFDASYWKTDDKTWMAERKAQWETIEPRLKTGMNKTQRAMSIIKRYFLKGIMPDFEALSDWKSDFRHLDLFCFIWLHPSRDRQVLKQLRDAYMHSPLVDKSDVWLGIGGFLRGGEIDASIDFKKGKKDTSSWRRYTGENELLFDILIGDLAEPAYPEKGGASWSINKYQASFSIIFSMGKLLCNKELNYINQDCLFQFDNYLEYWYLSCPKDESYFSSNKLHQRQVPYFEQALYRICHFDTEKEGNTCRTRFVHEMREILDEREFISEFKQIWTDVKAGKIIIENPWVR